ncbi:4-alpha-glucanotransferase [Caloramator quimbayensis]|uniref:4-alpha-glucanotransferase n=1 Tax=Caloramator quimbayensis TaxID=1147123 RepID=A0A1T4WFC2_9CLOT|nr:glycoside hydrolase family 13 protein [Caloramator quimbayensis]SKA75605.1 4-alpha-glucanotransferase [Caloramator quimbayensis]
MLAYHNSQDSFYRNPFGAVPVGENVLIRLSVSSSLKVKRAILRLWKDNEIKIEMRLAKTDKDFFIYEAYASCSTLGLLWYYFIIETYDKTYYYCNNDEQLGGEGVLRDSFGNSYQITVYDKNYKTPDWFKEAIVYQIFVDRFYNGNEDKRIPYRENALFHSNWYETPLYKEDEKSGVYEPKDFFGGNLLGVIKKLNYLRELGISAIYFNPIFKANSNHKYDTGDYSRIDPMFGNNEVFERLCSIAKTMGIRIILDGVFNHTGSDSIYFNKYGRYDSIGAFQSKDSPYFKWYKFIDYPNIYESWWGFDTLPNVNELEESYMDFIIRNDDSICKIWIKKGAKGWRLDVVDEIPDEFLKEFRRAVKDVDSDAVIIGEVWEDASNKESYGKKREYLLGHELDSVMNYPFRNMVIDYILYKKSAKDFKRRILSLYENYPKESFFSLLNLLGSHDVIRILTVLGEAPPESSLSKGERAEYKLPLSGREIAKKRLKLAVLIQMTFPGTPCIYYGDEAGVEGYSDPFNRRTYPWGYEDLNILCYYKKMTRIRNSFDFLKTGEFIPFDYNEDVFGFIRYIENNTDVFNNRMENGIAVILINRSKDKDYKVTIDLRKKKVSRLYDLLNYNNKIKLKDGKLTAVLHPLEGKILSSKQCYPSKKGKRDGYLF